MKNSSFLALLSGVAIGAIAGLLLAPDTGEETLRRVKENARDLSNKLQDRYEEDKGELKDQAERIKAQAKEFGNKAEKEIHRTQNKPEFNKNI